MATTIQKIIKRMSEPTHLPTYFDSDARKAVREYLELKTRMQQIEEYLDTYLAYNSKTEENFEAIGRVARVEGEIVVYTKKTI